MVETTLLQILSAPDPGRMSIEGLQAHPPLQGSGGEYYGHEWSKWRYDSLDRRVDDLLGRSGGAGLDILDIGCATGDKAAHFARAGHRVTALDIVDRSGDIAMRNHDLQPDHAQRPLRPIDFVRADIRDLSASRFPKPFDGIHARRVINFIHADAFDGFFSFVKANLKDGGVFVASFIANDMSCSEVMTRLLPRGTKPVVALGPGLYSHHVEEVHHSMHHQGLAIVEGFSDGLVEAGLVARPASTLSGVA